MTVAHHTISPIRTLSASPVQQAIYSPPPDSLLNVTVVVNARASDGVAASWTLVGSAKRIGSADVELVGVPIIQVSFKDTGATPWSASIISTGPALGVLLVGQLAMEIRWSIATSVSVLPA